MERTLKHSRQREYMKEILRGTKSHPDANWIFMEMKRKFKNVSLATVYRNLKLLYDTGQIIKIEVGDGIEHYDMTTENHYHFVCEKCSKISDLDVPVFNDIDRELAEKYGIEVKGHRLVFYGVCGGCTNNEGRSGAIEG